VLRNLRKRRERVLPISFEVFTDWFWLSLWGPVDGSAPVHAPYAPHFPETPSGQDSNQWMLDTYHGHPFYSHLRHELWEHLLTAEGQADLSVGRFSNVLHTLQRIVHDIFDNPLGNVGDWSSFEKILALLIREGDGEIAGYHEQRWRKCLERGEHSPASTLALRVQDAQDFLNASVVYRCGVSAHQRLVWQVCDSFGQALVRAKLLIRCQWCSRYARYQSIKKFCSDKVDGRNCGGQARYHRDYDTHRDSRRAKSREEMRENRKCY
jgi:hypothetical protein